MRGFAPCPICELICPVDAEGPNVDVSCARCGRFRATGCPPNYDLRTRTFPSVPNFLVRMGVNPNDTTAVGKLLAPYLSIYTREQTQTGRAPVEVDVGFATRLEELAETYANTPITLKPEKLLRLLERRTSYPGALATVNAQLDYPAIHAVTQEEFDYHLLHLASKGLISEPRGSAIGETVKYENDAERTTSITHEGWERLGATGSASRTGFVAMSFEPSLSSAFSNGIEPAIREAGYEPLRVDKIHHNAKICDRIVAEIRRARFVVADVTLQRPGVYFEAGFAMALGLPVIWCCRKDNLSEVHFDTRQYNHIVWEQPTDLRQQLVDRIRATIV